MEWWQAVILGIVEGVTEYLPVSSTGHLILTNALLGLDEPARIDAVNAFTIVIQGGAILAVLGLYGRQVLRMLRGLMGRDRGGLRLAINIIIAFLPAAVMGVLLNDLIESRLFGAGPVTAALLVGGVYMIVVEQWREGRFGRSRSDRERGGIDELTPRGALVIGLLQCVAMWPGTSRSMMTITGGVLVGLRPAAAAEFSFLLGLPTLGGAMVYRLAKDLLGGEGSAGGTMFEQLGVTSVLLGIGVATVAAALAVKWLVAFLNRHGLTGFGVYRIAIGIVLVIAMWRGVLQPIGPVADESSSPSSGASLSGE